MPVPRPSLKNCTQVSMQVLATSGVRLCIDGQAFRRSYHATDNCQDRDGRQRRVVPYLTEAPIDDIPSPLPGATWRTDSFPALALDGSSLHVVWSNWNGTDADVVYMRSTNGGTSWSTPTTIGGGAGDQFFPWVAAGGGKVYASWLSRSSGDNYTAEGWTSPVTLSSATSDAVAGNLVGYPNCAASFIGDYSGITVDASGTGHALWTDIRSDRFDPKNGGADQDPYTVTISAP
jgi:hypothetical protein